MRTSRKETNVHSALMIHPGFDEFRRPEGALKIIDIAAGQSHTLILTQPNKYEQLHSDYEQRQIWGLGNGKMLGSKNSN